MLGDWWRIPLVLAAIAVGVALSVLQGRPEGMPGASLGSPLLLHVERGLALVGLLVAALVIGVRATRGWFPARFGQIEYQMEEPPGREAVHVHEQRLRALEGAVEELAGQLSGKADMLVHGERR